MPRPDRPVLLRGVDRAAFAVALAARLRAAGVVVGATAVEDLVAALGHGLPVTRSQLYWTTRVCLVRRHADLTTFDELFAAFFEDAVLRLDTNARREGVDGSARPDDRRPRPRAGTGSDAVNGLPWVTRPVVVGTSDASPGPPDRAVPELRPAALDAAAEQPFAELDEAQLAALAARLHATIASWPTRRSRRLRIDRAGHRIALRPTLARARRTGWEPVDLVCSSPVRRRRRVVLLCDVSRSMQAQATAYLHLMRALARIADTEVFAFGTSLTRLTAVLGHDSTEVALAQANERVTDRFGGTRIATNLDRLMRSHHASALRGAVVMIASDGWDSDPPEQLGAAMARLGRRAHRVVWANPRAGAAGFRPEVSSMAAALPYCDGLLAADTFAALDRVVSALLADDRDVALSSRGSRGSRAGTGRR